MLRTSIGSSFAVLSGFDSKKHQYIIFLALITGVRTVGGGGGGGGGSPSEVALFFSSVATIRVELFMIVVYLSPTVCRYQ